MKPLVSILIPAYNAEKTIAETLESAIGQTWPHKEIIVVDDGSKDATVSVAREFGSKVRVVARSNQGAAASRNDAFSLSQGDFIQWLDADDILVPDKIERQMHALCDSDRGRILLSSSWAHFYHRTRKARFIQTSLCQDLTPAEWLLRKNGENLHMQTATWLTSRELAEAAGPWDTRLISDDDGEYFCRVLLASQGTRFIAGTGVLYRNSPSSRLSYIGTSDKKKDAMLISIKLHIEYLRSLEDSERVRRACLTYMQKYFEVYYPDREDAVSDLQELARELGGSLREPRLRWKYQWMKPLFGWHVAKQAQMVLPGIKGSWVRAWDKALYALESKRAKKRTALKVL